MAAAVPTLDELQVLDRATLALARQHLTPGCAIALAHLGMCLELDDWKEVTVAHLARLPATLAGMDDVVDFVRGLEAGIPGTALGANDAIVGLALLPASLGRATLKHRLLNLQEAAAMQRASHAAGRGLGAGVLTAEAIAEAVSRGSDARGATPAKRAKALDAGACGQLLDDFYGTGYTRRPELARHVPGDRAVSEAAYWTTYSDATGTRRPIFPGPTEFPLSAVVALDRTAIYDVKIPHLSTAEAARASALAGLAALDATAQQVALPAGFSGQPG